MPIAPRPQWRSKAAKPRPSGPPPGPAPYRYGVSGSTVEFVDQRSGRETIRKLLAAATNAGALKILNTSEAQLLED